VDKANASSQLEVLAIQEEAAVKRLGLAYFTARQAAQDYYDTTQRQQQRQLEGVGQGKEQRARDAGVSQIEDRFADQRRELENQKAQLEFEGKFTAEAQKQYQERLSLIREFQDKSLQSFEQYYDQLLAKQQDFTVGVSEATANYITESKNIAQQTEEIFSNAFGNIEDLITDFIVTGKGSFKDFADSITRDITGAIVKQNLGKLMESAGGLFGEGGPLGGIGKFAGAILGGNGTGETAATAAQTAAVTTNTAAVSAQTIAMAALTSASASAAAALATVAATSSASSAFSASSAAFTADGASGFGSLLGGFFADGGDPPLGKVSVVGERGPELFVPKSRGTIVPLEKATGAKSDPQPVHLTVNQSFAPGTDRKTINQAAAAMAAAGQTALVRFS
jgi:lambda family phage tail tape measure protein